MQRVWWLLLFAGSIFCSSSVQAAANLTVTSCPLGQKVDGEYLVRHLAPALQVRSGSTDPVEAIDVDRVIYRAPSQTTPMRTASFASPSLSLLKNRTARDIKTIAARNDVLSVEENCRVQMMGRVPNDPLYTKQWAHSLMDSPSAWQINIGSRDVVVAVIDSGVDLEHPDLKNNLWVNIQERDGVVGIDDDNNGFIDDINGYNFADDTGDPNPGPTADDGHGTHVAGIIGATGDNGLGVVGMVWQVRLMAVRVFPSGADANLADILSGIYYAVDNGARVLNLSIGQLAKPTQAEIQAYNYALDHDVLPVVAAGNNGEDASVSSPANIPGVFPVGALDGSLLLAGFSNSGPLVKIMAPGTAIYSTLPNSTYDYLSGTSMAAPMVAGAAALALSINPVLSQSELRQLIVNSGRTVANIGAPMLNPAGLVVAAQKTLGSNIGSGSSGGVVTPKPSPSPSPSAASPSVCTANCSESSGTPVVSSGTPSVGGAQMAGCGRIDGSKPPGVAFFLLFAPLVLLGIMVGHVGKFVRTKFSSHNIR